MNYSDSICVIIQGIAQIQDKITIIDPMLQKASLYLSGVQLLPLSDNYGLFSYGMGALISSPPLAGSAFALAMFCDLINLSMDLHHANQELHFVTRLDERAKEIEFSINKIINNQKLSSLSLHSKQYITKLENLNNLILKEKNILSTTASCCLYACNKGSE